MCFHYALTAKSKSAKARFSQIDKGINKIHVNGFTNPKMPVILDADKSALNYLNWGLVPSWVKSEVQAKEIRKKTLNARAETIFEKDSFKESILTKKCLILASGYYEYHNYNGKKYPYYFNLKSEELFAFAGIWSTWKNNLNTRINSFSILTVRANSLVEKIHNKPKASKDSRMPLILSEINEQNWLECQKKKEIQELFTSYPENLMQARLINKIGDIDKQADLFTS